MAGSASFDRRLGQRRLQPGQRNAHAWCRHQETPPGGNGCCRELARRMQYRKGMKLQLENPAGTNLVRSYGPGQLRIGERTHSTSLIVTATAIIAPWRPTTAQELTAADLEPLLGLAPEVVLLGTGARQQFPDVQVLRILHAAADRRGGDGHVRRLPHVQRAGHRRQERRSRADRLSWPHGLRQARPCSSGTKITGPSTSRS